MAPTNNAAFLQAKGTPLKIKPSKYTSPGKYEVVIRNAAVAINPYDWIIQEANNLVVPWVKLPVILGTDVAGEVVEVGQGVTRFKVGDRVVAFALGLAKEVNKISEGGFQEYTVVRSDTTTILPDSMSFETASVMPLGLSTAACALFQKDFLALPHPTTTPEPTGKTVLIWGGSTSVGCNAIQLAVAAGCEVITTASPKNHNYLKSLGASKIFDYKSKTVVSDIITAFENRIAAGAISIGSGSYLKCIEILGAVKGNKFVAQATLDLPPFPKGLFDFPPFLFAFMSATIKGKVQTAINGVKAKMINGSDLGQSEVGAAIFKDYLPKALADQKFIPAPEPQIVGKGLEHVQEAMDMNKRGVSAKKLVVTL